MQRDSGQHIEIETAMARPGDRRTRVPVLVGSPPAASRSVPFLSHPISLFLSGLLSFTETAIHHSSNNNDDVEC